MEARGGFKTEKQSDHFGRPPAPRHSYTTSKLVERHFLRNLLSSHERIRLAMLDGFLQPSDRNSRWLNASGDDSMSRTGHRWHNMLYCLIIK